MIESTTTTALDCCEFLEGQDDGEHILDAKQDRSESYYRGYSTGYAVAQNRNELTRVSQ